MLMSKQLQTPRREFLKIGAMLASTSMVQTSHSVEPSKPLSNERLETAVIGIGRAGEVSDCESATSLSRHGVVRLLTRANRVGQEAACSVRGLVERIRER